MNVQNLAEEVRQHKEIKMSEDMLHEFIDFQTPREVKNLESVLLVINGHKPLTQDKFDIDKFKKWCLENQLLYRFSATERSVYLYYSQYYI